MIIGNSALLAIDVAEAVVGYSKSVGRLLVESGENKSYATCFLIGPDLALTAGHVVGVPYAGSITRLEVDLDFVGPGARSKTSPVEETVLTAWLDEPTYLWAEKEAQALYKLLYSAYTTAPARMRLFATAGIDTAFIVEQGSPVDVWFQAIGVVARAGRLKDLITAVLNDEAVAGFHEDIREITHVDGPTSPTRAQPAGICSASVLDVEMSEYWAVLKLDRKMARTPLPLGGTIGQGAGVVIIQHPHAHWKQFVLALDSVTSVSDLHLQYLADTAPGSSGAPFSTSTCRSSACTTGRCGTLDPRTRRCAPR